MCQMAIIISEMGNKSVECRVRTEKPFYYPGEEVMGKVYVNSPDPYPCSRIVVHIQGVEKSWWKGVSIDSRNNKISSEPSAKNKLIEAHFVIYQWGNKSFLKGQYVFPFMFRLPSYIPGSFYQKQESFLGQIHYLIRASCISSDQTIKNIEAQQELVVREAQRSLNQTLYGQMFLYPKSWFRQRGVAKISCYFDSNKLLTEENHYIGGQYSTIICEVDNFKSDVDIKEIKCEFVKSITLTGGFGEKKTIKKTVSSTVFPGAKSHSGYIGKDADRKIVQLKYPRSDKQITPSTSGSIVNCQYYIEVHPILGGCCNSTPEFFCVKVIILHQGIQFPIIEEPSNWNPEVYNRSQILLNYGDNNQRLNMMSESDGFM